MCNIGPSLRDSWSVMTKSISTVLSKFSAPNLLMVNVFPSASPLWNYIFLSAFANHGPAILPISLCSSSCAADLTSNVGSAVPRALCTLQWLCPRPWFVAYELILFFKNLITPRSSSLFPRFTLNKESDAPLESNISISAWNGQSSNQTKGLLKSMP